MTATILPWALGLYGAAMLLCTLRLLRGPAAEDRVLALDTLYVIALALVATLGLYWRSSINFEAVLAIAMLGFAGTVAAARYLIHVRRDVE
jgi:multicomponent K+:H+ antiporter subunit F